MSKQFNLTIELGNDALQSAEDIAMILHKVAQRLIKNNYPINSLIDRGIMDSNGNTVGSWHIF